MAFNGFFSFFSFNSFKVDVFALNEQSSENIEYSEVEKQDIITSLVNDKMVNVLFKRSGETIQFDFAKDSRFQAASWMYENNIISYEEKLDIYCDLINSGRFENQSCINPYTQELG